MAVDDAHDGLSIDFCRSKIDASSAGFQLGIGLLGLLGLSVVGCYNEVRHTLWCVTAACDVAEFAVYGLGPRLIMDRARLFACLHV